MYIYRYVYRYVKHIGWCKYMLVLIVVILCKNTHPLSGTHYIYILIFSLTSFK